MENKQKIDLKQREHLASLLSDARRNEKTRLEQQNNVSEDSILRAYAESKGYTQSIKEVQTLNEQITGLETQREKISKRIQGFGFDVSNRGFSLRRWSAPDSLIELVDKKLDESRRPIEKSLKNYDLAIAHIWTAMSGEELQKVVEGVI